MSRMNVGGRLPRQGLYRGAPSPLPPRDDAGPDAAAAEPPSSAPVRSDEAIPKPMAEQLMKEHQEGQDIEMLALRWGLTEEEITKAIARLGGLRK